jgi:hypothetical protein
LTILYLPFIIPDNLQSLCKFSVVRSCFLSGANLMDNNRRDFLKMVAAGAAAAAVPAFAQDSQKKEKPSSAPEQKTLPRWRGFNLLEMFTMRSRGDFRYG